MRILALLLFSAICCASCSKQTNHDIDGDVLVEVDGNSLSRGELESVMPAGLSKDDSTRFADSYIRGWVEDVLLYEQAKRNVNDSREIERQVESYRKTLLTHSYQQQLIAQSFSGDISDDEMREYYDANRELFRLDAPLLKGLFVKIPANAQNIGNVRAWYKSGNQQSIDNLEKYAMQNAVRYEYFHDEWVPAADLADLMPLKNGELNALAERGASHTEYRDDSYVYFLNITEVMKKNEVKPFDMAKAEIKEILTNMRQVEYMKKVKDDLYNRAVERNMIIYNK